MIKLLLVDDEYYFIESMKVLLPWERLGFKLCPEASNGREALQIFEEYKPDIIIADINMPLINGLELVRYIRDKGYGTRVVFLTGYGEFEYAKEALQLGVRNYLLKPVNEEELEVVLQELKVEIENESRISFTIDELRAKAQEVMDIQRERFLFCILQGKQSLNVNMLQEKAIYFNVSLFFDIYQVVVIEIDNILEKPWNEEDRQLWRFGVSNIMEEIMGLDHQMNLCSDNDDRICLIIGFNERRPNEAMQDMLRTCEKLRSSVARHLGFTVSIGVGNVYNNINDIVNSYKEAIHALGNKLIMGSDRVISYWEIENTGMTGSIISYELENSLLASMRLRDITLIKDKIHIAFSSLKEKNTRIETIHALCFELISICYKSISEVEGDCSSILYKMSDIINQVQFKKSIHEVEMWVIKTFSETITNLDANRISKNEMIINNAKDYINKNYQRIDFKVKDLENELFINSCYLSHIFKRETEKTIIEYVIEVRLQKAKEMMDKGYISIADIAEQVGYLDSNYFGKCFKKLFGITPSEYIKLKSAKD